jgi:hypothetical protein
LSIAITAWAAKLSSSRAISFLTSRQFVDHLEAKLTEHGVSKVIPEEDVIESQVRYLLTVRLANQEVEKVMPRVKDTVDAMDLPAACASGSPRNSSGRRPGPGIAWSLTWSNACRCPSDAAKRSPAELARIRTGFRLGATAAGHFSR